MNINALKSIYPISKFKYIWTMITNLPFVVISITDGETKEKLDFSEPLITISKNLFILTDLDFSINSVNKRIPVVIKSLRDECSEDKLIPGRKSYTDEKGEKVVFTKINLSYFLDFRVNGQNIVLHFKNKR